MVTPEAFSQLYAQLPPLAYRVLGNKAQVAGNASIREKFKLNPVQWKKFMLLLASVVVQEFEPRQLLANVKKELDLDDATAKSLTLEALGRTLLPLEWHIGEVQPVIRDLGGELSEYLKKAKELYPEVYSPAMVPAAAAATATPAEPETPAAVIEGHPVLHSFDDRVSSFKGRAEVLLRLTGLSVEVEEAVKSKKLTVAAGEQLLKTLDGLSYAVNTKDLNALEIEALKRGIKKVLRSLAKAKS